MKNLKYQQGRMILDFGKYMQIRQYFPTYFGQLLMLIYAHISSTYCREHQLSPVEELTYYYAYSPCDASLAGTDRQSFSNVHINSANKRNISVYMEHMA